MKKRLKKAFTITELVIVIAVIAVLAAVLIPTFASVVKSANKSADETYLKNISDTIGIYTAAHGNPPKDYPEMMEALAENNMCDPSNPYLLATKLKEDNVRMVWFPNTEKVQLIDTSRETLLWQTGATRGMGNYALVGTVFEDSKGNKNDGLVGSGCYVLCVAGDKSCEAAAKLYYDFYVTCGGDITKFNPDVSAIEDKGWANCIVAAANNLKQGYHTDDKIEEDLINDLNTSSEADIEVKDAKEALSALATLATLANDATTKDKLIDKSIKLNVTDDMKTEGVDMKDVTIAAIGNSYRKESNVAGGTPASTVSVDYGGLTLKNVNVPKNYVSSGAEYQDAKDSGHTKGGYAFTYGMFGSIIAAPNDTVTIENLTIKGVQMDFTGATETINGKKVETFADNAGVIAGYVQGNVIFKNITIDGAVNGSAQGYIKGYDAIAGVVGRAYGAVSDGKRVNSKVTLEDVIVKNLSIEGERRASGFVGYNALQTEIEIKGTSADKCGLENVTIKSTNNYGTEQCWATIFVHRADSTAGNLSISNVSLKKVTTEISYKSGNNNLTIDSENLPANLKKEKYIYVASNPTGASSSTGTLLLVCGGGKVTLQNIKFNDKNYTGSATQQQNGAISVG